MHARALVLWDVDGTLISESRSGRLGYEEAVARVLGRTGIPAPQHTGGGTDWGILERMLIREGFAAAQASVLIPAALHELEDLMADREFLSSDRRVLDGVSETITALDDAGAVQSLVTGNSRRRALAKLGALGLADRLDLRCGGFGDRTSERWRLVEEARERAGLLHAGREDAIPLDRTFVIGDTIHDIAAARDAGARAVGVATGSHAAEALVDAGAELVLADLGSEGRRLGDLLGA